MRERCIKRCRILPIGNHRCEQGGGNRVLPCSVLSGEGQDLPERSGETVRVQGQGDLCGIQTVQVLSALNHILAEIVEKSETRSNYTSSLTEKQARQAYLRSIWQTLQDVTRLKVCILNSWKLESA